MLTCKEVCENATGLTERKTGLWHRLMLRLHLMMCRHCRNFLRQLDLVMGATRRLDEPEAPTDEEIDRILARLRQPDQDSS